jgi:hypothetical protein
MLKLHENWLTDGLIDFEYKKYMLLAYLKAVEQNFTSNKLYPYLGDLVWHYENLLFFMKNKNAASQAFPKQLSRIDLENFVLSYEEVVKNDSLMAEIERILDFSIPAIKRQLEEGREIYDWIESQLMVRPVGIESLQLQYGYLFLRNGADKETQVYNYRLTIFQNATENFRGIHTDYVNSYTTSIVRTYETIKAKLINEEKLLVPPSVYVVESDYRLPLGETLLPIAKRVLVRHLAKMEQR